MYSLLQDLKALPLGTSHVSPFSHTPAGNGGTQLLAPGELAVIVRNAGVQVEGAGDPHHLAVLVLRAAGGDDAAAAVLVVEDDLAAVVLFVVALGGVVGLVSNNRAGSGQR